MNGFRFPVRLARRRLAVFSVALAAALGGVAAAAAPASADVLQGTCLDANAQQVWDTGAIAQWQCQTDDPFQDWTLKFVEASPDGYLYQLQNLGALENDNAADCLDADANDVGDGGTIQQWGCNPADPYQLWIVSIVGRGTGTYQNYGALTQDGAAECLDADAQEVYSTGKIFQWACDSNDPYQEWQLVNGPNGSFVEQNLGADLLHSPY
jgi:hypothetical protein